MAISTAGLDSSLIGIINGVQQEPGNKLIVTPLVLGGISSLGGWAIKTILGVSAPHYALITGITTAATWIILNIVTGQGHKHNLQHYKIRLLVAATHAIFNTALIVTCVSLGIFASPVMTGLAITFAALIVADNLIRARTLYQETKKPVVTVRLAQPQQT
jgi:hypothetical protein